jgi:FKBP-type peptidyl-prolyl cis-trans isomerase FkpA
MKKFLLFFILFAVKANVYCQETSYTKTDDGMEYKIIPTGKGELLKNGQYMEVHFISILQHDGQDSVLSSTREMGAPQILSYDSISFPKEYFKIFKQMRNGDSLTTKTSIAFLFKNKEEQIPPFMKKSDFVYTNISIQNIYSSQTSADSIKKILYQKIDTVLKSKAAFRAVDDDLTLSNYMIDKDIKTIKTANGVYVQTIKKGTGAILKNNFVKINYTGKTLDGKMFDSNTDPSKGHTEPLLVNLTDDMSLGNGVILGMKEALLTMQKGTKAIMYIPSGLGYGPNGAGSDIGPNSNLIFEVEVLSTLTLAQFKAEQNKPFKKVNPPKKRTQIKKKLGVKK